MDRLFELHSLLVKDCIEVMDLPLSKLLLMNDKNYPWLILVPRVHDVTDIYQLDWEEQQQLLNESSMISEVMMQLFDGKKMNVAALGNICPQLHLHHIVRKEGDNAWPAPVWGAAPPEPYSEAEQAELMQQLTQTIEVILSK
ncbi:HIT domain-containing protein [Thalassotalea fusca]